MINNEAEIVEIEVLEREDLGVLEQLPGETTRAYNAICDYYMLGAGRSVSKLLKMYRQMENPPTKHASTVDMWQGKYDWKSRVNAHEVEFRQRQMALFESQKMEFLAHQVDALKALNDKIIQAAPEVDISDIGLPQYTKAVKTFIDAVQQVFDMQPVTRVSAVPEDHQSYSSLTANEAANKLEQLIDIRDNRKALTDDE